MVASHRVAAHPRAKRTVTREGRRYPYRMSSTRKTCSFPTHTFLVHFSKTQRNLSIKNRYSSPKITPEETKLNPSTQSEWTGAHNLHEDRDNHKEERNAERISVEILFKSWRRQEREQNDEIPLARKMIRRWGNFYSLIDLMVSTEASWWNILNLKI